MAALVMRWRGPLMSLAGARIDGYAQQMPIPSLTMVAGLLGAALGYRRGDERLPALADSLRYGVVVHRPGTPLVDFQTADLATIGMERAVVDPQGQLHLFRRAGEWRGHGTANAISPPARGRGHEPGCRGCRALERPATPGGTA
jgi:CRISPR-associated Cas5-like protein